MTKPLPPEIKAANKIKFGAIRSERMKGIGNPFYGKHHSKESIEKNRIAHIGKKSARRGVVLSETTKRKLRECQKGKSKIHRDYSGLPSIPNAKCIPLSDGGYAIVDSDDYDRINAHLWSANHNRNSSYARRALPRINGCYNDEKMHHAIIGKPPNGMVVDHINGNGLDNRKSNLRVVTNRQNCQNKHHYKITSKYPGVTWCKKSQLWVAQAQINGKHVHIGSFSKEELAYEAYCKRVDPLEQQKIVSIIQCPSHETVNGSELI